MATAQQVVLTVTAATSTPVVGTANNTSNSAIFTPQLGRDMYLTLSGTWDGSVQVQRSVDGGSTWNNITIAGGQPWGHYTDNCDEVIDQPTDSDGRYRLSFVITTGTVNYRLAQ